jgi:hypothetical protein
VSISLRGSNLGEAFVRKIVLEAIIGQPTSCCNDALVTAFIRISRGFYLLRLSPFFWSVHTPQFRSHIGSA